MTEREFLEALKQALEQDLDEQAVRDNVNYYAQYIHEELQKGRSKQQVLDELGDPWVIARSIIDSPSGQKESGRGSFQRKTETARNNSGYGEEPSDEEVLKMQKLLRRKMWMIFIAFILIVICVIAVLTSLIRFFAPVIFFVIVIWLIFSLLDRRR